jgi:hypothetical protein
MLKARMKNEPPLIPPFRKGGVPKKAVLRDGGLANSHDA